MRVYKEFARAYLTPRLRPWRKERGFTQEKMAEKLRMSSRSYAELERGESGFSATTLLLFLCLLPDEEILEVVKVFLEGVLRLEEHEAA